MGSRAGINFGRPGPLGVYMPKLHSTEGDWRKKLPSCMIWRAFVMLTPTFFETNLPLQKLIWLVEPDYR